MPWFAYIVIAFMVVCFMLSIYRMRRNGPGPAVNYVPKAFRPRLNAYYRRNGWQEPFDAEGNRNPDRGQVLFSGMVACTQQPYAVSLPCIRPSFLVKTV